MECLNTRFPLPCSCPATYIHVGHSLSDKKCNWIKFIFFYICTRVHHKYTETDADPHNARRGFFFSHMGWLMVRKHKEVFEKGGLVDMSDLEKDPIVMFQKR